MCRNMAFLVRRVDIMPSRRQPIDLVVAKGKAHLTKAQIEKRRAEEISIPESMRGIEPPEELTTKKQQAEFMEIASKLRDIGIWGEIDADCLARYILGKELYAKYTKMLSKLISRGDEEDIALISRVQIWQDKAFRQCHQCAQALGMTITSRCKIVIPQSQVTDDDLEL